MENLSRKPFYLTDEDILWVGDTLADMSEEERIAMRTDAKRALPLVEIPPHSHEKVKPIQNEGSAAVFLCENWDEPAIEQYRACINAGAMCARAVPRDRETAAQILYGELGFNGVVFMGNTVIEADNREACIKILGLRAGLGYN